jgi:hypothetical protein
LPSLPVAVGSATAKISAAEAAKSAAARISTEASAISPTTASPAAAAAEKASQQHSQQEIAATTTASATKEHQKHENPKNNQGERNTRPARARSRPGRNRDNIGIEWNTFPFRNLLGHGLSALEQGRPIIAGPQTRTHGSQGSSGKAVVDKGFDAAPRLDVALAIADHQQQKNALTGLTISDTPFPGKLDGEILNGSAADCVHRDESKLDAELALYRTAKGRQLCLIGGPEHVSEIVNISSGRWQGIDIDGQERP